MWQYNYTYTPELYHHGVKDMKLGVRKVEKLRSKGKYAKADKLEQKIKDKEAKKEFNTDVKSYLKLRSDFGSALMKSVNKKTTQQDVDTNTEKLLEVVKFTNDKNKQKGKAYVNKLINRADTIQKRKNTAGVVGFFVTAAAATAGYAYLQSKFLS